MYYYLLTQIVCYEIDEDYYKIMNQHKELFGLSNYPKNSNYFCNDN